MWVVCLGYLTLDVFSYGLFGGQPGVPGVAQVRSNPDAAARYADFAIRLNPDRGIPLLGRAELARRALPTPASDEQLNDVIDQFEMAVTVDPYNPLGMQMLYDLQKQHSVEGNFTQASLLGQARLLAPQDPAMALRAISHQAVGGNTDVAIAEALAILDWCEYLARRDREGLDQLGRVLVAANREWQSAELDQSLLHCRSYRDKSRAS